TLHQHPAGLGINLQDLALAPLVITAHDPHLVALGDAHLLALAVDRVAIAAEPPLALAMLQYAHVRAPPARATRSSCTACREARAPPDRRYASHAAPRHH